ncbi:AfsR/SARP family transcriptional regulator [Streptomyces yaizuensis]|uniref:AAA family ATPase n=1 Tax=Streptomyces yaizuensis TaxID=2989713 RepID=A0ABQ5P8J5_9ACTN|nr:BTAD domain-containing putative transcriptional regulator [Streptomyces sp. YSPA8]GLF98891.1 AAA family ATPase [Streptomyces sp. YSPA8]
MTDGGMRFRVLGGLEWYLHGDPLEIGRRRERLLLGLLLLDINRVMPAHRLIDFLWDDVEPPSSARGSLQVHVSRLRGRFQESGAAAHGFTLARAGDGYLVEGDPLAVDLHRFRARVQRAERTDDPAERLLVIEEALADWGGPVLAGTASDALVRRLGIGLEELHLSAVTHRAEARLALGQRGLLLEELARATAEHPHHERLAALRMIALYRADHRGEALEVYHAIRVRLAEDLGLDPRADLRRVHELVLRAAPELLDLELLPGRGRVPAETRTEPHQAAPATLAAPPAPPVAPPPDPFEGVEAETVQRLSRTGAFIGRSQELEELSMLAAGARGGSGVVMIVGPAGSGKTALALQWCRTSHEAFPDGQLFLDLRGHSDERPMGAREAFSGLLRALGIPYQDLPCDPPAMAELYQRTLASRRVLIVLDNAESADQVRQLLPYESGCLALVTSRNRLGALIVSHGAAMLPLRPLASDEAEELVRSVVGPLRSAAEPEALADLVTICGRSPLALRIAAANLALRPDFRIADHVRDLRSGNPLESLAVAGDPDSAVRRAFELSYRRLDAEAADGFRLLGLLPGPATTTAAVAALWGRSVGSAHHLLDRLFAEHLVERTGQERLRLHDLIWWYARLLVDAEKTEAERREARHRLLRWYAASADAAARSLYPQILRLDVEPLEAAARPETFEGPQQAAEWFDAEHLDLVKLIEKEAVNEPPLPVVWILADTLRGYFWLRRHADTWVAVAGAALRAAREAGDFRGQAAAHQSLGLATFTMGDLELSRGHFEHAIELARRADWGVCESVALCNLAGVSADLGLLSQAAEYYDQSITIDRRLQRTPHQPLQGLSEVLYGMGRLREAERLCRRALALSRKISAPDSIARISTTLALISVDLGELEIAHDLATASRKGFQDIGNLAGEAEAVCALAMIAAEGGNGPAALRAGLLACRLGRKANRPRLKLDAMLAMGHARYQLAQYERAYEHFRIARRIAEEIGYLKGRAMALLGLGVCAARFGRPLEALCHAGAALALAQESQLRLLEGQAQSVMALAHASRGDLAGAGRAGRQAEAIHRATGYRPVHSPYAGPLGGGLEAAERYEVFRKWQATADVEAEAGQWLARP